MKQFNLTIPEDILFSDSLTPTDKLVYGLLFSENKPSVKEISEIVNRSERTIWRVKKKYAKTDTYVSYTSSPTDTYVSDMYVSPDGDTDTDDSTTDTNVTIDTDTYVSHAPSTTDTDDSDTYVSTDTDVSVKSATVKFATDTDVSPSPEEKKRALSYCLRLIDGLGSEEDYNKNKKKILKMFERHDMFTEEEMAMFDEKLSAKVAKFEEI